MKPIKYKYIILAIFAMVIAGCEKEYEDEVRITYFPDFEINGDEILYTPAGTPYADAGAVATENDQEIEVTTTSNVDSNTPGSYTVGYTARNSDGFSKTVERKVVVYDPNVNTTDISGVYNGSVVRNGSEGYSNIPVSLTKVEGLNGIYTISDWISGFYANGRNLGNSYKFVGLLQINAQNEVILLDMSNPWGDPFDNVTGTYNPATNTISYTANWIQIYAFVVNLVKQ